MSGGSIARLLGPELDAPSLRNLLWSTERGAIARYVLARSRGFGHRSSSRLASDLLEVFVMSQIAVPSLALLVGAVAVMNGFLNSLREGVLRAHACAAREGRLFPPTLLLGVSWVLVLAPYAALLWITELRSADVLILVALRVSSALVDASVGAWTARVTILRRPYLSPWVTWLPVGVAIVAGWASLETGGRSGVIGLAWSMAVARIVVQLVFLRAALRGVARPAAFAWPGRRDVARMAVAMIPFAPAFVLASRLHGTHLAAALFAMPLFFKLAARPFQATELDLRNAIARYGAPGAQAVIHRVAALTCAAAFAGFVMVALPAVLLGAGAATTLLLWMALLGTGRALVGLGSTFDAELRGWRLSALVHGAQCLPLPVPLAVVLELAFVVASVRAMRPASVARALAPRRVVHPYAPERFFERYDGRGLVLEVRLYRAHRSRRAVRSLLDRLEAPERVAVDAQTLLVWWPELDASAARDRGFALLMAAPREIAGVRPVTEAEVRAWIDAPTPDVAGRAWRMSAEGTWVASDGARAAGDGVPVLLEAQRDGDRSVFCRGVAKVRDPRSGEAFVARRARGRTIEVVQSALVIALSLVAIAPRAATAQLTCSPEDGTEAVRYKDELGRAWSLVDFRFDVPTWQRPHLACNRWLESLSVTEPVELRALYGGSDRLIARLDASSRARLHQACALAPPCRVAFPYNLYPGSWTAQLRARLAPRDAGLCDATAAPRALVPRGSPALVGGLTEVEPWFTPVTRVSDELVRLVRATRGGDVFASTMTLDTLEVARVAAELERADAPRLFLVFDLNTVLADGALELFGRELDGLYLVPYFNTPRDPRYYHVKGAASGERLLFSGANLKAYDRLPLFDLGFSARGPAAAQALSATIARQARAACDGAALLECTLAARFPPSSPWPARIRAALARSCAALAVVDGGDEFAASDRDDLAAEVIARVTAAQRSVVGTTHHLDHGPLEDALAAAPAARVHVGRGSARVQALAFARVLDDVEVEVHTKALLIDDDTLVWGSGNLTDGGLGASLEIAFQTRQAELVGAFRRYVRSVERLAGAAGNGADHAVNANTDAVHASSASPAAVVWLSAGEERRLDRAGVDWRHELTEARSGLAHFYAPSATLRACIDARDPVTFLHRADDVEVCLGR